MIKNNKLCILIPSYNEEKTIAKIIKTSLLYGKVVVVDDGSTDRTAEISIQMGAIVVKHKKNLGYDSSLESGFKKASELQCKYLITIDADGQHDTKQIINFEKELINNSFLVLGIRDSFPRMIEYFFSFYTNLIHGIKDPLCGFKGYNMLLYLEQGCFDNYKSIGTQLTLFGSRNKFKISQIPVKIQLRNGKSRYGKTLKSTYRIFRSVIISIIHDFKFYFLQIKTKNISKL